MASVEKIRQFFVSKDKDGSGTLDLEELQQALKGQGFSRRQVQQMFKQADLSRDGKISLDEFLVAMGAVGDPAEHRRVAMMQVCMSFDVNSDGHIDKDELKKAINDGRGNQDLMTDDEADRLMEMVDADQSGSISYKELCNKVFGYDLKDE